jgi:hypothetical protein
VYDRFRIASRCALASELASVTPPPVSPGGSGPSGSAGAVVAAGTGAGVTVSVDADGLTKVLQPARTASPASTRMPTHCLIYLVVGGGVTKASGRTASSTASQGSVRADSGV